MDHYRALGVDKTASSTDLRNAYRSLIRQHHPDRQGSAGAAQRRRSEVRMHEINAAWSVLGDETRRAAYDREQRAATTSNRQRASARERRAREGFRPFDPGDDPVMPAEDVAGKAGYRHPGFQRWLGVLPPLLFMSALGVGIVGALALPQLLAVAIALFVLSLLSFLAAPLVALTESARNDRR
ncbi:MAG: J domain-containing protein [Acidimicrobiales bacterium]|nr:J domain-containing protein [Acidimicrobiales bacterium]